MTPEEQQKERQLARHQELNDIKVVLSTKEGRRFIWRFLQDAGIFRNCASFESTTRTFWSEGRREFALRYFNDILECCGDDYLKMARENKPKERVQEQPEVEL